MIVLVDLDGVTADLEKHFWEIFTDWYPDAPRLLPEDRTTFYIEEQIGQEWTEQVRNVIHARGFYRDLEPIPGAIDGIHELQDLGANVIICTSPVTSLWCAPEKIEWVTEYLGPEMATRMIISKDKTLVRGDILFDDRPDVHGAMEPTWLQILCMQPYNVHVNQPIATWATLPKVIGEAPEQA